MTKMLLRLVLVTSLVTSAALGSPVKGYADSGVKGGPRALLAERHEQEATKTVERQPAPSKTITQQQLSRVDLASETQKTIAEPQRQLASKTSEREEQKREEQELLSSKTSKLQQTEQQREEIHQVQEIAKEEQYASKGASAAHYEAKTQVRLEEKKGGQLEHSSLLSSVQQQQQLVASSSSIKSTKAAESGLKQSQARADKDLQQQRLEQEHLEQQSKLDQQRLEQQRLEVLTQEQQRLEQQRVEQIQQQRDEQQSVDLYEQRRLDEQRDISQHHEESKGAIKGQQQVLLAEPEPYAFDYSVEGSSRRESGDNKGVVRGQYTLQNPDGSSRVVDYVADQNGFRAIVNTNEFGTESRSPAGVELRSSQPAADEIALHLEGKTRESLELGAVKSAPAPVEPVPKRPDNWNVKQQPISLSEPAIPQFLVGPTPQLLAEEQPRAIKGKTSEEIRIPLAEVQQKTERDRDWEQSKLGQQAELITQEQQLPAKGELRAPKSLPSEQRKGLEANQRSASFESATAHHRPNAPLLLSSPAQRQQQVSRQTSKPALQAPAAPVHRRQYLQPATNARAPQNDHQVAPVSVGQLIRNREPNGRSPFYANTNPSESVDDSASSFESPVGE